MDNQKRQHFSFKKFKAKYAAEFAAAEQEFRLFQNYAGGMNARNACLNDFLDRDGELDFSKLDTPAAAAMTELKQLRIMNLLREFGNKGYTDAFKLALACMLEQLDIDVPDGVLTKFKKDPGAKQKSVNNELRERWDKEGRPSITDKLCYLYAAAAYPDEWKRSRPGLSLRIDLRNRVRTRLLKYQQEQLDTKFLASIP